MFFKVSPFYENVRKQFEKRSTNRRKIDANLLSNGCQNHVCKNIAPNDEKVKTRSQNVVPRLAQGLQNEALELPKFTKKSDLDPPRCQEVAPEASEVPPRPKISRKSSKIQWKFNRKVWRILAQSNANLHSKMRWKCIFNFTASSFAKLNAKIQWPRRAGRSPLG